MIIYVMNPVFVMKSEPSKIVTLYLYFRQCCGAGSGGSVIKIPHRAGSTNSELRIPICIRLPILTSYQRFGKILTKSSIFVFIFNDLLPYLFATYYLTTDFFTEHKKVQVGSEYEINWPPGPGSVSINQDYGSASRIRS